MATTFVVFAAGPRSLTPIRQVWAIRAALSRHCGPPMASSPRAPAGPRDPGSPGRRPHEPPNLERTNYGGHSPGFQAPSPEYPVQRNLYRPGGPLRPWNVFNKLIRPLPRCSCLREDALVVERPGAPLVPTCRLSDKVRHE